MSLCEAASAHFQAYCATIESAKKLISPTASLDENAGNVKPWTSEWASNFLPNAVLFGLPEPVVWKGKEDCAETAMQLVLSYLRSGLGFNPNLKSFEIRVVAENAAGGFALCFSVWELQPPEKVGIEPFEFEQIYGFRKRADGTAGFELIIADGEVTEITKRVPSFLG